jgi:hypothetical protein
VFFDFEAKVDIKKLEYLGRKQVFYLAKRNPILTGSFILTKLQNFLAIPFVSSSCITTAIPSYLDTTLIVSSFDFVITTGLFWSAWRIALYGYVLESRTVSKNQSFPELETKKRLLFSRSLISSGKPLKRNRGVFTC